VLLVISAYFFATAVSNVVYLRRATRNARIRGGPFVSVIVPARDEEGSIARCLESLLSQDYADYEVIVVDDDSSDATAEIVAGIAASTITGQMPLTVGVMVAGTAVARWGHEH